MIFSCFREANFICATRIIFIFRLNGIVFPSAINAYLPITTFRDCEFATAGTSVVISYNFFHFTLLQYVSPSRGRNIVLWTRFAVATAKVFVRGSYNKLSPFARVLLNVPSGGFLTKS